MAFWNSTELSKPPSNTSRIKISWNDLQKLQHVFNNISSTFSELKPFHTEAAMLSRTIYKLKSKFHSDTGFQKLAKVNRALLNYLAADFSSVYSQFANMLQRHDQMPGKYDACTETYMPTRQMLEWVLVRTQGFARLFCAVATTCEESSRFWMNRITIAQSWNVSVLVMGVLGRIWVYSKYLVVTACQWYSKLKPFLDVLRPHGMPWKPADYVFPEDLKLWLNVPHITDSTQIKPTDSMLKLKTAFSFLGSDNGGDLNKPPSFESKVIELLNDDDVDVGEAISRDEAQLLRRKKPQKKSKKKLKTVTPKRETSAQKVMKVECQVRKLKKNGKKKKARTLANVDEEVNKARKVIKQNKKVKDKRKKSKNGI